jgi:1,6-anhydro-N-acetylmuramate kinase
MDHNTAALLLRGGASDNNYEMELEYLLARGPVNEIPSILLASDNLEALQRFRRSALPHTTF